MVQQLSYRAERVNELIRRELVLLLKKETKDPRLQNVVITDVIVTRDLTSAKVFFSVDESSQQIVASLLKKASGFFSDKFIQVSRFKTHTISEFYL